MNTTPNPTRIVLSPLRTADVDTSQYNGQPVIRIWEDNRLTPGQWFAKTIATSTADPLYIDFGQNWKLTSEETVSVIGFAGVVFADYLDPDGIARDMSTCDCAPEDGDYGSGFHFGWCPKAAEQEEFPRS